MFFQADSSLADTQWSQSLKNLIIGGIYKPCGQPRGRGVPKMSMFVHMGEGGSKPLSMWIMIPTFLHLISGICKYWMSDE